MIEEEADESFDNVHITYIEQKEMSQEGKQKDLRTFVNNWRLPEEITALDISKSSTTEKNTQLNATSLTGQTKFLDIVKPMKKWTSDFYSEKQEEKSLYTKES